ncbi:MAG: gamma-glutamyl-gamma-aminobutyrate hydrolase family protein, partial [Deltaproteobacteria bacterium]|nr:gamma-glutamyl-gamma-aminobutyrate hydrolase family protein [Deltaproteobacteria bacterium]
YARQNKVPYFGICLGMQMAVIEYARDVIGLPQAHSSEFDRHTPDPVIYLMREWYDFKEKKVQRRDEDSDKGGTMRLGAYPCRISAGTLAHAAYGQDEISERHRHRYEFNNDYRERLAQAGMIFSGVSPDDTLVEIMELRDHPWFLGCQFHPEFKSRPMNCHPLFRDFIEAALAFKARKTGD